MSADATGPEPTVPEPDVPGLETLPPAVRSRVVALVAGVLPDVPRLPPPLRRVADFAPARRARAGGAAIAAALADDGLREQVAVQLGPADAPDRSATATEPVEQAARAWLQRPEGWTALLRDATHGQRAADPASGTSGAEADRLRRRLEQAEQAAREQRAEHRARVEEYKAEVASLRRKLGETRSAERAARAAAEEAAREVAEVRSAAESLVATQDKDLRRLRTQVAALEAEVTSGRRAARAERRTGREEATLRARVLLDTVVEAAAGLQRELGLPLATGSPGDRVEAELAEAGRGGGPTSGSPASTFSPAVLEQHLAMPRARLVVDGYNVSKTAWPDSALEAQRIRLLNALGPLVARTGAETTVVFDAAASTSRPVVAAPRGVKVLFSPEGVIADDVIRELVAAEPPGRVTIVVTSDREVVEDVARAGARPVASRTLVELMTRAG